MRRSGRLPAIKRFGGATGVAKTGLISSLLYGCKVFGANGGRLALMRKLLVQTLPGKGKHFPHGPLLQLHGLDPAETANAAPIATWAQTVWEKLLPKTTLQAAWRAIYPGRMRMRNPWLDIRGPFAAMIATLARLNWRAPSATTLKTDSGKMLDLEKVSPKEVAKEVALATQAGVWKDWTLEASGAALSRPFLFPTKRLVAKKLGGGWTAAQLPCSVGRRLAWPGRVLTLSCLCCRSSLRATACSRATSSWTAPG